MNQFFSLKEFKNNFKTQSDFKAEAQQAPTVAASIGSVRDKLIIHEEISKKSVNEIKEYMNELTQQLIDLYYETEISILNNNLIDLETGIKIKTLRSVISFCKILICQPGIDIIILPKEFVEEYKNLLNRTNTAIDSVKKRIKELGLKENAEKNLLILKMLKYHYVVVLETDK